MQLFKEDDDKETVEKDIVEFAPRGGGVNSIYPWVGRCGPAIAKLHG